MFDNLCWELEKNLHSRKDPSRGCTSIELKDATSEKMKCRNNKSVIVANHRPTRKALSWLPVSSISSYVSYGGLYVQYNTNID